MRRKIDSARRSKTRRVRDYRTAKRIAGGPATVTGRGVGPFRPDVIETRFRYR